MLPVGRRSFPKPRAPRPRLALLGRSLVLLSAALLSVAAAGAAVAQPSPEPTESPEPSPTATAPARESCPEGEELAGEGCGAAQTEGAVTGEERGVEPAPAEEGGVEPAEAPAVPGSTGGSKDLAAAADASVSAEDNVFAPAQVTVTAGETVFWSNNGQNQHTVTADDGSFDSGTLDPGGGFSLAPGTSGTIRYYCQFHGAPGGVGMSGVIVVQAAAAPAGTTPEEPGLAVTGFDAVPIVAAGLGLLALGLALLVIARRRRAEG